MGTYRGQKGASGVVALLVVLLLVSWGVLAYVLVSQRQPLPQPTAYRATCMVLLRDGSGVNALDNVGLATLQLYLGDNVAKAITIVKDVGAFKPAAEATYVYGSDDVADSSPSACSFWVRDNAETFQKTHGGEVLSYSQLVARRRQDLERTVVCVFSVLDQEHGKKTADGIVAKLEPFKDRIHVRLIHSRSPYGNQMSKIEPGASLCGVQIGGNSVVRLGDREIKFQGWPTDYPCPCGLGIGQWTTDDVVAVLAEMFPEEAPAAEIE